MSPESPAYDEASMVKTDGVSVNTAGVGLTITPVEEEEKGLFSGMRAVTLEDVEGTSLRGDNVEPIETAEAE